MEKFTISRNDDFYEAFADVVKTKSGVLICTYREALTHSPVHGINGSPGFCRIIVRRSLDGGLHWGNRQIICATEDLKEGFAYNCSRLVVLANGTVMLVVDRFPPLSADQKFYYEQGIMDEGSICNIIFRSTDDGKTWTTAQETSINTGIVPSIKELNNGDLLLGVCNPNRGGQLVHRSEDGGLTWSDYVSVPFDGDLDLNEGDFVELDNGVIVLYMREDNEGFTGWRSYSNDGGRSWSKAVRCRMLACRGRPSVGLLSTGEVFITYRIAMPKISGPRALALFVESQEWSLHGDDLSDSFNSEEMQRFQIIDVDRNLVTDSGYSGWVELDDGSILVVNYINEDAPRAFIRGYILNRRDWILSPPGNIDWVGKGNTDMDDRQIDVGSKAYRNSIE